MVAAQRLLKASLDAGRQLLRPLTERAEKSGRGVRRRVAIRSIDAEERDRILRHLVALDEHDRYLRFGYAATDEQIGRYVSGLNFDRDKIFGIYDRRLELLAMAHLAYSVDPQFASCAEFGVSVAKRARGRGYGSQLFERAVLHARNEGVVMLFIHALSENTAMLTIARHGGATVERDGSESEAYLRLPEATLDTRVSAVVEEQLAALNYQLKAQARQFRSFLAGLQEVRQGVRDARHKTGS